MPNTWIRCFVWTLLLTGAISVPGTLYFTQTLHSIVVPESTPVGSAVVRLYVLESPEPEVTSSVVCRIRGMTIGIFGNSKSSEFKEDDCPFTLFNTSLWLYVRQPLNDSLEITEPTIYNLNVECYIPDALASAGDNSVTTEVVIAVCDDSACGASGLTAGAVNLTDPDTTEMICFGGRDEVSFEVYENSGTSTLGSVNPTLAVVESRTGWIRKVYSVRQTDHVSSNVSVDDVTGELTIDGSLDREVASERHLTIDCHLHRDNATESATVSKTVTVVIRDVDDNGPVITSRFLGRGRDLEEIQVELVSLAQGVLVSSHVVHDKDSPEVNHYDVMLRGNVTDQLELTTVRYYPKGSGCMYYIMVKLARDWSADVSECVFDIVFNDTSLQPGLNDSTATFRVTLRLPERLARKQLDQTTARVTPDTSAVHSGSSRQIEASVRSTAQKYSRILELSKELTGNWDYSLNETNTIAVAVFNVTSHEGIVYVAEREKLSQIGTRATLRVLATSVTTDVTVTFTITVTMLELWSRNRVFPDNCDDGCSEFMTAETCESGCGYGAIYGRCHWRRNNSSASVSSDYETCSPSLSTCPDRRCDELETLVPSLCPQDCTEKVVGGPFSLNRIYDPPRGIVSAVSPCWCNRRQQCTCMRGLAGHGKSPKRHELMGDQPQARTTRSGGGVRAAGTTTGSMHVKKRPLARTEQLVHSNAKCDSTCLLAIVLSLGGAVVVMITAVTWRIKKKRSPVSKQLGSIVSLSAVPSDYVDDHERQIAAYIALEPKWEFPRQNLVLGETLGEGEFGRVVRAKAYNIDGIKGYKLVAVKMLKENAPTSDLRDLLSEYNLLKDVNHKNVVRLLGVCTRAGPFFMIVEHCKNGSLLSFLRNCRQRNTVFFCESEMAPITGGDNRMSPDDDEDDRDSADYFEASKCGVITAKDLLSFAWQTANGMQYLADMKLVHRDLAARNILLNKQNIVKISDFGLTRDVYVEDAYVKKTKGRLPIKWMAPESLYDQLYTTKTDVWSYGVVLWEIVTLGAIPYPGVPPERLCHLLKTGYRMEKPGNCSTDLYDVMTLCWQDLPSDRPAFKELAATFENMLRHNVEYLDLGGAIDKNPIVEDDDETTSGEQMETTFGGHVDGTPPHYSRISNPKDSDSYVIASSGHCHSPKETIATMMNYAPRSGDNTSTVSEIPTEHTTLLAPTKIVTNSVDCSGKQKCCDKLNDNDNPEELRLLPEARI